MSTIEIFNPNIMPYGQLSNNYKNVMSIRKQDSNQFEIWNTVTQYIYTNMIDNYKYRELIKNTPVKDIYNTYLKYFYFTQNEISSKALYKALLVKFENPSMQKILLNTGYGNILYATENNFLGIGVDGTGQNILGKYLMQIRQEIRNRDLTEVNNLYKAYVLYFILNNDTFANNDLSGLLKNVLSFDNNYNNLDDLINKYNELYPGKSSTIYELLKSLSTREYFENTIKTNPELKKLLKSSINNPSLIIFYIRKERLKILKDTKDYKLANIVFNVYIDSIIKKKFPELSEFENMLYRNCHFTIKV